MTCVSYPAALIMLTCSGAVVLPALEHNSYYKDTEKAWPGAMPFFVF